MSPGLHSTGTSATQTKRESGSARILGSASAGVLELALFHPIDTIGKRLMSNQTQIRTASQLNSVIFREYSAAKVTRKFTSLFPGLGYAACYKILQRIYKYGGQRYVKDFLAIHYGTHFDNAFGKGTGKTMLHATAGSLMGIGEIILLPLDVLKIKRQTNPEAFRGRGVFKIIIDEKFGLYRGALWTAARNAPGSFALFGGSAFAMEYGYKLTDYSSATALQNAGASIAGAVASLIVSSPLDVVKTRIQNTNFESRESGVSILKNLIKHEGFGAFFKGLIPKLLTTGPKLAFSRFAVAQTLIPLFDKAIDGK
ncbi:putative mitochondrial carrier [Neolecta irregularis DAH-3]|uniref:Putative mitochondrial carrier n=1 Tax=Neolecta irregularis (strain DAH-3) TaxID=1198029 RepID=A0A1U7LUL5_NEOID|nr:putative mitochondrial carrier [Neolecta irregularis DAH-3]|eukprot:OLL26357.1 putative mitochondrial carrier [Neolecta irregularis DAH-3]